MILSKETVDILKNFQTINPSILVRPGNVISTIAPSESMFARATVLETFPKQFCFYDLTRFLGLLSLADKSEIEFEDNYAIINQGYSKIKYTYCNPELITSPPDKSIVLPDEYCQFTLKADVLQNVIKAMSILGFNELWFSGEEGKLFVQTANSKNVSSDNYKTEIGDTDKTFNAIVEADKLKLLSNDYLVTVCQQGMIHLKSDNVDYWIALQEKSEFK